MSAALHAAWLALPVVPLSGEGGGAFPVLQARLVPSGAAPTEEAAAAPAEQEDRAPPETAAGALKNRADRERKGPGGGIESTLSAPYLDPSEVDVRASPLELPALILPAAVLRQHLHGRVELRLFIAASGRVDAVAVLSSSHPGLLEEAAIDAARASAFSPAYKSGVAVRSSKRIEVIFDPDDPGPAREFSPAPWGAEK